MMAGDAGPAPVPTHDPSVLIEDEGVAGDGRPFIQYRRVTDGRRWRVIGTCVKLGSCIEGAVDVPPGDRPTRPDIPVTPEFRGCCPFAYEELPGAAE